MTRSLSIWLLSLTICAVVLAEAAEDMILIPAGTFTMGSDTRAADEKPMHKVYLDAYYIGKYEVTNAEYYEFWKQQSDAARTPENFSHLPQIGDWPARAEQFRIIQLSAFHGTMRTRMRPGKGCGSRQKRNGRKQHAATRIEYGPGAMLLNLMRIPMLTMTAIRIGSHRSAVFRKGKATTA